MMNTQKLVGGSLSALMMGMSTYVAAQPSPAESSLEEIVVTARRREESIQSVPVSVAAFSTQALREASISTLNDIQFQTPGVFLQGSASPLNAAYSIRGQGLSIAGFGLPGVITYFAEVPLPAFGSGSPQYDMSSIQVLKGPQGTLFGRNTTGGAVLLTPAAPVHKFESYLQASVGNYNLQEAEGMVNIPFGTAAALRVAGRLVRQDGWTENRGIGGDLDNQHANDVRVSLLLTPSDWFTNTTIVDYSKTDNAGGSQIFYATNEPTLTNVDFAFSQLGLPLGFLSNLFNTALAQQVARGPYITAASISPKSEFESRGVTNRTQIDIGSGLSITNILGYRRTQNDSATNIDGVDATFGFAGGALLDARRFFEFEQYTDELQLRGEAGNLRWLTGAFYLNNAPSGPTGSQVTIFGAAAPAAYRFYEETSKALYANVAYELDSLLQGLTLNAGFRYTWDDVRLCDGASNSPSNFFVTEGGCRSGALVSSSTNSADFTGKTWTVGLDYQVTEDVFVYLTSRRGYRGGGINSPLYDQNPANPILPYQTFKPDVVTDVELGLRSEWDAGSWRGRTNLSVFRSKTEDAQRALTGFQTQGPNPGCFVAPDTDCNPTNDPFDTGILVNYGDTRVDGVDAELMLQPVSSLTLNLGAAFLDPKTESINPAMAPIRPVLPALGFDPNKVPFDATPERTYTVGLRWELPFGGSLGEFVFNADYFWVDDMPMVAITIPSYDVTNVRVDWNNIAGAPLDVGLFARNVFDDEYVLTSANPTAISPYFTVSYGPPRMYGVQLRYRFGE